jgi:hypothetical protein
MTHASYDLEKLIVDDGVLVAAWLHPPKSSCAHIYVFVILI